MKKIFLIATFLFGYAFHVICRDNIYYNFDYSVFRGENGKSILEIYYSVPQKSLKYTQSNGQFSADALIRITVVDLSDNKVILSNSYKTPSVVADTSEEVLNKKLIGQINYLLSPGRYKLQIKGSDYNDTLKNDYFEQEISIGGDLSKLKISDIELSTLIQKSNNTEGVFYKNTLEIIPNPSGLFGMNLSELYYYFEIYGLTPENVSSDVLINYQITDLNNQVLISRKETIRADVESKAEFGKIQIDSLVRGTYIFKVILEDSLKNINISSEKKFFIFNNLIAATNLSGNDFLKSEYGAMSKEEVENEFEKMNYILSEKEISRFNASKSINDRRKFLFDFWRAKDSNPNTPVLETKIAYLKRVSEANKTYTEAYKEGWKTDRGRIYIIYGKPDDVERFPFQADRKSYEIWKYYTVEGGGECVFIELQPTTSVYWLVHSTFRNELRNEDWELQLNPQ